MSLTHTIADVPSGFPHFAHTELSSTLMPFCRVFATTCWFYASLRTHSPTSR